ncbi:hypothetical protein BS17DRAFT_882006 [Gyrodon lividus]|nr:hypothetical protein BS17DRAFT_882006 [Gyrodon lividus]
MLASLTRYNTRAVQERKEEEAEVLHLVTTDLDSDSEESTTWEETLFSGQTLTPSTSGIKAEEVEVDLAGDSGPYLTCRTTSFDFEDLHDSTLVDQEVKPPESAVGRFQGLCAEKRAQAGNREPMSENALRRDKKRKEIQEQKDVQEMLRVIPENLNLAQAM